MTNYKALKASVQEPAEREWYMPAIEARYKRLAAEIIIESIEEGVING